MNTFIDSPEAPASHTAPAESERITLTPQQFGVGARVTLAVMSDDYVSLILGALGEADATGLQVTTGDVSTFVGGAESDILRYLSQLIGAVGRSGAHLNAVVHFSRGCPGEVLCERPATAGPVPGTVGERVLTGVPAVAEWALYPLEDGVRGGAEPDHMRDIDAAIDFSKSNGTFRSSEHFVTRLEGDVADVLHTVALGWILVGRTVQHVTSHVTLSINSPFPNSPTGGTL
ncbi:YkoF family thiamine/hydroxymethylpyrimidine-binding protein [Leifsonia kafniensis]|uniref:YkoF family thiamine/hydroxymethylpyrimidine-binding protein n=1 Tax=Leifsonia kafniensis TaxID=475957 RepID=A0ABP7K2K6_9MICO